MGTRSKYHRYWARVSGPTITDGWQRQPKLTLPRKRRHKRIWRGRRNREPSFPEQHDDKSSANK